MNISISVSDYRILAALVPVMFVFCNTNHYNFIILEEKEDHCGFILYYYVLLLYYMHYYYHY